jgi:hypothetical protein
MANQKPDEKILKDAQYRKGLSIAFFNATNSAISLITSPDYHFSSTKTFTNELYKLEIVEIRDWLLEEHKNYYATVIANVGQNYKTEDSIAKLKATKSLDALKTAWQNLSQDERSDGEIIKVCQEEKKKYE